MECDAIILNKSLQVTLDELCELCRVSQEEVLEMIDEGIIDPEGTSRHTWLFCGYEIKKVQIVIRLQRDLRVNLPGAAVTLSLLEEIEELKKELNRR